MWIESADGSGEGSEGERRGGEEGRLRRTRAADEMYATSSIECSLMHGREMNDVDRIDGLNKKCERRQKSKRSAAVGAGAVVAARTMAAMTAILARTCAHHCSPPVVTRQCG